MKTEILFYRSNFVERGEVTFRILRQYQAITTCKNRKIKPSLRLHLYKLLSNINITVLQIYTCEHYTLICFAK